LNDDRNAPDFVNPDRPDAVRLEITALDALRSTLVAAGAGG
jgi:hypothetical protein